MNFVILAQLFPDFFPKILVYFLCNEVNNYSNQFISESCSKQKSEYDSYSYRILGYLTKNSFFFPWNHWQIHETNPREEFQEVKF
jgi:hypothetical protein